MSFSPRTFLTNFSVLHSAKRYANQDVLTKSSLLDLLGYECEGRKKLYDYLHENVCQGWRRRDPNINAKPAEEVLEGRKHNDERVITSTNVFYRLRELYVTEIWRFRLKGTYGK